MSGDNMEDDFSDLFAPAEDLETTLQSLGRLDEDFGYSLALETFRSTSQVTAPGMQSSQSWDAIHVPVRGSGPTGGPESTPASMTNHGALQGNYFGVFSPQVNGTSTPADHSELPSLSLPSSTHDDTDLANSDLGDLYGLGLGVGVGGGRNPSIPFDGAIHEHAELTVDVAPSPVTPPPSVKSAYKITFGASSSPQPAAGTNRRSFKFTSQQKGSSRTTRRPPSASPVSGTKRKTPGSRMLESPQPLRRSRSAMAWSPSARQRVALVINKRIARASSGSVDDVALAVDALRINSPNPVRPLSRLSCNSPVFLASDTHDGASSHGYQHGYLDPAPAPAHDWLATVAESSSSPVAAPGHFHKGVPHSGVRGVARPHAHHGTASGEESKEDPFTTPTKPAAMSELATMDSPESFAPSSLKVQTPIMAGRGIRAPPSTV